MRKVEVVKPPITVIARLLEINSLAAPESASGIRAKMVAKAVIQMGRRRVLAASMIASFLSIPLQRFLSMRFC